MRKKAVVAGMICLDMTPLFPDRRVERLDAVLAPGKLIHMKGVDVHMGGCVANTGIAMKLLGADVRLVGMVGEDAFGKLVLNALAEHGAQEHMIVRPGVATSYSVVLAVPGVDRVFLHDCGANDCFGCDDLDPAVLKDAALFHFGYPPIMRRMYERDGEELERLLRKVRSHGLCTSLDMASVDPSTEAGKVNWRHLLQRVMPLTDFFVPSAEELCVMLAPERYQDWLDRAEGRDVCEILTASDVGPLADTLLNWGAKVVLVKCGAAGLYCRTAAALDDLSEKLNLSAAQWAGKEIFEASYVPSAILSGTGAGDTCIAAFLTSVLNEEPLEEALHLAAATGACCVAAYDAHSGLKPLAELKQMIRAGWAKRA